MENLNELVLMKGATSLVFRILGLARRVSWNTTYPTLVLCHQEITADVSVRIHGGPHFYIRGHNRRPAPANGLTRRNCHDGELQT